MTNSETQTLKTETEHEGLDPRVKKLYGALLPLTTTAVEQITMLKQSFTTGDNKVNMAPVLIPFIGEAAFTKMLYDAAMVFPEWHQKLGAIVGLYLGRQILSKILIETSKLTAHGLSNVQFIRNLVKPE